MSTPRLTGTVFSGNIHYHIRRTDQSISQKVRTSTPMPNLGQVSPITTSENNGFTQALDSGVRARVTIPLVAGVEVGRYSFLRSGTTNSRAGNIFDGCERTRITELQRVLWYTQHHRRPTSSTSCDSGLQQGTSRTNSPRMPESTRTINSASDGKPGGRIRDGSGIAVFPDRLIFSNTGCIAGDDQCRSRRPAIHADHNFSWLKGSNPSSSVRPCGCNDGAVTIRNAGRKGRFQRFRKRH